MKRTVFWISLASLFILIFTLGQANTKVKSASLGVNTVKPLDFQVDIAGNHTMGEWVTFSHSLGPEPQSLHPVRVYSLDYGTLYGPGKDVMLNSQDSASRDMFGDGRDGLMPASGNLDSNNGFGIGIVNSGSISSTTINVTNAYNMSRINPGDVVLIHQTQGNGAGCWELNTAISDFGTGPATYQLAKPLQCNYSSTGNSHAQILRVPQYTSCNVSGSVTPLSPWNGAWGGVFAVMCNDTMTVSGIINATGFGFRGGPQVNDGTYERFQGEGEPGLGGRSQLANGNGGGGGHGEFAVQQWTGGAGGGNGTVGVNAIGRGSSPPSYGGNVVGNPELTNAMLGGGGGGYTQLDGGNGGGFILISARTLNIGSLVSSNGTNGTKHGGGSTGSGGGAGGSILLRGENINLTGSVNAVGGAGGASDYGSPAGAGGAGRVRIEYCNAMSGTSPTAITQKLNCYITEQIEAPPYNQTRLKLPESFGSGQSYMVQYGRFVKFNINGSQTITLHVPTGQYISAKLDALFINTIKNNLNFQLDIGADGTWDWAKPLTITQATTLSSPELAAAFNNYWQSQGSPNSGDWDVPVAVYSDQAAQILFNNLTIIKIDSPTPTNTPTPTDTLTPTNTPTNTPSPTATSTPTGTPPSPTPTNTPTSTPIPTNTPTATPVTPWVVMVYLNGDNDLDPETFKLFNQLEAAVYNDPSLIIQVLWDHFGNNNSALYQVQPDNRPLTLADYKEGQNKWSKNELDMGDRQTLLNFIIDTRAKFPASHYLLSIVDHGGGWSPTLTGELETQRPRLRFFAGGSGFSWDETNNYDYLSTEDMGYVFSDQRLVQNPIDIVFYDACLMAMLEEAYEIRKGAHFLVASQYETWTSFPYVKYLEHLNSRSPEAQAVRMVQQYHDSLPNYAHTMSAMNLAQIAPLTQAVNSLASALAANMTPAKENLIRTAYRKTQKLDFDYDLKIDDQEGYIDIGDFAAQLQNLFPDTEIAADAQAVRQALYTNSAASLIIEENHLSTYAGQGGPYVDVERVTGLSIYLPFGKSDPDLKFYTAEGGIAFVKETDWANFIFSILKKPQSPMQDDGGGRGGATNRPHPLSADNAVYLPYVNK